MVGGVGSTRTTGISGLKGSCRANPSIHICCSIMHALHSIRISRSNSAVLPRCLKDYDQASCRRPTKLVFRISTMHFNIFPRSTMAIAEPSTPAAPMATSSTPKRPLRTTKETHPNLPPGLILDENGKVCKVCNSWQDWAKVKKVSPASSSTSSGTSTASALGAFAAMAGGSSKSKSAPAPVEKEKDRSHCPPDTAQLGRSTWTFLHTTAAYYPVEAPPAAQRNMLDLLRSLSLLYPCSWCADDFRTDMRTNPPDVSGRAGLSRWLCERHNEVNEKLGKGRFDCSWESLDRRWKDGPDDGSCD